ARERHLEPAEERQEQVVREGPRRRHALERNGDSGRLGQPDGERDGALVALALQQHRRLLRALVDHARHDLDLLRAGRLGRPSAEPAARAASNPALNIATIPPRRVSGAWSVTITASPG